MFLDVYLCQYSRNSNYAILSVVPVVLLKNISPAYHLDNFIPKAPLKAQIREITEGIASGPYCCLLFLQVPILI